MTEITPDNVVDGMEVIDGQGYAGIILDSSNLHDINVEYNGGGAGLYCLVKDCPNRKPYHDTLYMKEE